MCPKFCTALKPDSDVTVRAPALLALVHQAEHYYGTCILSQVSQAELILSAVPPVP